MKVATNKTASKGKLVCYFQTKISILMLYVYHSTNSHVMYFESKFAAVAMKNIEGNIRGKSYYCCSGGISCKSVELDGRKGGRRASPGGAEQRGG